MSDNSYLKALDNGELVAVRNATSHRLRAADITVPEIQQGAALMGAVKSEIERRKREVPYAVGPGHPDPFEGIVVGTTP